MNHISETRPKKHNEYFMNIAVLGITWVYNLYMCSFLWPVKPLKSYDSDWRADYIFSLCVALVLIRKLHNYVFAFNQYLTLKERVFCAPGVSGLIRNMETC